MKKTLIFLLISICAISCKKEEIELHFTSETLTTTSLEPCQNRMCPEIDIKKITATGDAFADTVNKAVNKVLVNHLISDPDEAPEIKTLDEALYNFINSYRIYLNDFPESEVAYVFTSTSKVSYESDHILSLVFDNYSYWGGAHGYGSTTFINFDKQTQQQVSNNELFKDEKGFLHVAEKQFRNQAGLSETENINSTGFLFENDRFILPENIGFQGDQLILNYTPYEVAAYSEGQLTLKFPLSEIEKYLRPDL